MGRLVNYDGIEEFSGKEFYRSKFSLGKKDVGGFKLFFFRFRGLKFVELLGKFYEFYFVLCLILLKLVFIVLCKLFLKFM